jgi:hypothetical protein
VNNKIFYKDLRVPRPSAPAVEKHWRKGTQKRLKTPAMIASLLVQIQTMTIPSPDSNMKEEY